MKNLCKFSVKLFFLFFLFLQSNAAIITKIVIEGNNRVSDETIKVYGDIKENENIDEKKINEILNNLYSTNFFEDVQINEINGI